MAVGDESAYLRQLGAGVAELRFEEPLETRFREHYPASVRQFLRVASSLSLVFVGVSALLDWRLAPDAYASLAVAVKTGLMAPALLVLVVVCHTSIRGAVVNRSAYVAAAAVAGGSAALLLGAPVAALEEAVLGLHLAAGLVYVMLGLRLVPALALSLPLAGLVVWAEQSAGVSAAQSAYDCVFVLFTNAAGAFACFRLEVAARTSFLEREVVGILSATDAVTGIPNRRLLNRHLKSLERQAERERKGLALMFVSINDFDGYARRYGSPAVETSLRRIAHTIVRLARRPLDLAARVADGVYAIALYDPDPAYLQGLIRQVRARVVILDIPHAAAGLLELVTVSCGAAMSPAGGRHDAEHLKLVAEQALGAAGDPANDGVSILTAMPGSRRGRVARGPWPSLDTDP
jgi:diguanylate cyclase (GGDEF)-like protein